MLKADWELSGHRRDDFLLKLAEHLPQTAGTAPGVIVRAPGVAETITLEIGKLAEGKEKVHWELNRAPNAHMAVVGNYGEFQVDEEARWRLEITKSSCKLVIPSGAKMASLIDGQHRLLGFDYCMEERKDMELLCSVYMDLPQAYQAYLFATIDINQRKVDKSLAYEQFGYNLDEEDKRGWAPDKCAVFLARRLNLAVESPLFKRIKIAPLDADIVFPESEAKGWRVSTACVVEGIIPLISSNSKSDRDTLHKLPASDRRRSKLPGDNAPLRNLYRAGDDEMLYALTEGFLSICRDLLWATAKESSYITKTIGLQGQFDVMKRLAQEAGADGLLKRATEVLPKAKVVNFSDSFFQASGKGRIRVRNAILLRGGLIPANELPEQDRPEYMRVCGVTR